MSQTSVRTINFTCALTLTEREVYMLAWLAGYGGKQIAEAIHGKLTTEFSKDEWEKLWQDLRGELEQATKVFRDTKAVFTGWKVAKPVQRIEEENDER